jgi:catechol 2,3-dioxygenase-like lactoylglutathione lyase family enzyme
MPLDHMTLTVPQAKLEDTINFLTTSLQPLGFKEIVRPVPNVVGLGEQAPYFWLNVVEGADVKTQEAILKAQHIAFTATSAEQVRQFHAAALKAGGTCNGPPGLRAQYHPGYYAAFVHDVR